MSLRAARNVSAGRHWPAGRTLRTNGLRDEPCESNIHLGTKLLGKLIRNEMPQV